jgi:NitT/TauT family transport system permease protein
MTGAAAKTKKRKTNHFKPINIIAPLGVLVVIVAACQLIATYSGISPYILPKPSDILVGTVEKFGSDIAPHFFFTLRVILIGFLVATAGGMLLAAVFSQFGLVTKAVSPVIIWLVITPMITLVPLLVLWLGYDPNLRVWVVIVQAMPIITLNTLNGFTTVETEKLELAKSVGVSRFQRFTKIIFMNAMPQVFTGIKLGCIFSTIAALSADFVSGNCGMGFRITQYTKYNLTHLAYGCILLIALIGLTTYSLVSWVEKRVVLWKN